ncbi:MAG: orotate phosphoribosyltransferase [candidate division NC10 bacterium]|nr:orotate phosphoribosyltransferase [candidate division NC10 bacterium]MBI3003712.1 orotate phosphoribosyltransferase [candidate division NC10 bacterium]
MPDARQELLHLLYRHSFQYSPEPTFRLASGRMSQYYINCKATTFLASAMPLVGRLLWEAVRAASPEAVGGPTLGADPLAYAVAFVSAMEGKPVHAFSIRKEPKPHGLMRWIEGYGAQGARVAILEDVITTGESTLKAIRGAEEGGFRVVQVAVLVDRQEGGRERVEAAGYPFVALYTREDFMALHRAVGGTTGSRS